MLQENNHKQRTTETNEHSRMSKDTASYVCIVLPSIGEFQLFSKQITRMAFLVLQSLNIYIYSTRITSPEKKQHEHMHILVHIFMYIHLFRFCFVEHLARTTFTPHVIGDLNGEICIITFLPMCLL